MKAEVVHKYGGPEVMKFESFPDPVVKPGEILIRVAATSINPVDIKRRTGEAKDHFPINFPDIVGVDVSGTVEQLGQGVTKFKVGDKVYAMAQKTYAELCAVDANVVAKIPEGLDLVEAARIPLATTTGYQVVEALKLKKGQTVLITGAVGAVGRAAVYTALQSGAKVIVAVRKKQFEEAESLGAHSVIATDDGSLEKIERVDAVADMIAGEVAELLISKIKDGGAFATVLQPPKNAANFPQVKAFRVQAKADAGVLNELGTAVAAGKFEIPISEKTPMRDAAQAQEKVAKGGVAKVLLVN